MAFNIFKRKPKPKPEIKRLEVSEYGEPKYEFTHIPTLEVYREYNDTVSAPAIERDKKLKKVFGLIMGVITIGFAILSVKYFDLPEYLAKGRTFFEWMSYTGFMFYFLVTLMAGFLTYHFLTFYQKFPKRLEKATADYYKSSKYLTNEIILALWEELFKTEVRIRDFNWLIPKPEEDIRGSIKVRHTKWECPECTVHPEENSMVSVRCDEAVRAPARGQAAVIYCGERVLGGGYIV